MTRIVKGDALRSLHLMADESVQCCVTSPPYWGLRDYGTGTWHGGRARCNHKKAFQSRGERPLGKMHGGFATVDAATAIVRERCPKCGARRVDMQIGLEDTPEKYVARLVEVFRQVRRVLRDDGTLWLNLGDSYAAGTKGSGGHSAKQDSNAGSFHEHRGWQIPGGLKPKDLIGIPWRVAFALQADGWYLRSEIIWHKLNPMPESVRDRPSKAHEHVFLLAKSRKYYYDAAAIVEPCRADTARRYERGHMKSSPSWEERKALGEGSRRGFSQNAPTGCKRVGGGREVRNCRSVWPLASAPFKGAHFATFPPKLIEPCILAGCPPGGIVLDPFAGACTTGVVAELHGRDFIGIELNSEYCAMGRRRIASSVSALEVAA